MAGEKFVFDVPGLAYLEHQIIQIAARTGNWSGAVKSVEADFGMEDGALNGGSFRQTRMLSLLYCVFVVPREIFGKGGLTNSEIDLAMATWQKTIAKERAVFWDSWSAETLINHVRHAVAHADFSFEGDRVLFRSNRGKKDVEFTMTEIETFIAVVGSSIANSMSARRKLRTK